MIKECIPYNIKTFIKYVASDKNIYKNKYKKDEKKIFIALAANYGNLGDVAITYAQKKFLIRYFPEYKVIEIPIDETYKNMKALKQIVGKDDIITIIGGGNFGNIYISIERMRQYFIKKFPNNKIICFPQTIEFSQDLEGKKELKRAKNIYEKHKKLVLLAREQKSFENMKKNFKNTEIFLIPDIVLSLNEKEPEEERKNITICFRKDKENNIDMSIKKKINEDLERKYNDILIQADTHVGDIKISEKQRSKYLKEIWEKFKKSKLVVTDRLHGMIFCAITGTPCIALPNSNGKIESTYNTWLKNIRYIKMLNSQSTAIEIESEIEKILQESGDYRDIINLEDQYKKIIEIIEN